VKRVHCPFNGWCDETEFVFGGEVVPEPPADAPASTWAEHIFYRDNERGIVDEWWCHTASGHWVIVRRNRSTDEIVQTLSPRAYFDSSRAPE